MTTQSFVNRSTSTPEDLTEVFEAYRHATARLEQSHQQLGQEVVRLRRELAGTNAQLQRSKRMAALGEMAAGIAHEIRNPLAAIQLYADMLEQDLPSDTQPWETARKIATAVRGLEAVVSDVLVFAKELKPQKQRCLAIELFERAVDLQRPAILNAKVVVEDQQIDPDLVCEVDSLMVQRALGNVLRNAIDAMAQIGGGVLSLATKQEEGQIIFQIADQGPGIDKDQIDRIFNPFFTTRNTGTGLGLAIVHRIVDAHGGSILVHNDHGAVFQLYFPMATPLTMGLPTDVKHGETIQ